MKKIYLILSVALAVVAAASCQKESLVNDDNTNVPASPDLHTFTATIAADTKAATADDGRFTFTAGDFIYIFNGDGVKNADGNKGIQFNIGYFDYTSKDVQSDGSSWGSGAVVAESKRITADMISNDGKTLTFSTSVAEPADDGKWYFLLADGGASWQSFTIRPDSDAWTRFIVNQNKIVCYAGIDKASFNGSIAFKHYDSQFRFKVSNISDYDKVTITPNSGAVSNENCISANYEAKRGQNKYDIYAKKDVSVALSTEDANKVYYVGVVPNRTWTGGIKFHLWKDEVEVKTLTISKDITIGVGDIIDFGDLAKVRPDYTSLYEKYQAGYDINVGGVIVNKETYGEAKLLGNGATLSGTSNKGVFFVEKGAKVLYTSAWNRLFEGGDAIIIGDATDGTRSTLEITGGGLLSYLPSGAYGVAFKNIDIESTATQPLFNAGGSSKVSWIIFDNCKLAGVTNALLLENNFGRAIGKIVFKDSEFRITKANTYFLQSSSCSVDELVVDNCIFYSNSAETAYPAKLFDCTPSSLTITNNTFVNVYSNDWEAMFKIPNALNIKPVVKNNLRCYYTVAFEVAGKSYSILVYNGQDYNDDNCERTPVYVSEVIDNVYHPVIRGSWNGLSGNISSTEGTPFSSADFTNGVFTNTTTYGAKR